jgi:hypothetical protein
MRTEFVRLAFCAGLGLLAGQQDQNLRLAPQFSPISETIVPQFGYKTSASQAYLNIGSVDPIFRAASLVYLGSNGVGHGALVKESGGYRFYTVEHVVNSLQEPISVTVPEVNSYPLLRNNFDKISRPPEREGLFQHILAGADFDEINEAVKANIIEPLELSAERPAKGELVAIPNTITGQYDFAQFGGYNDQRNVLSIYRISSTAFCHGQSGSPVLRTTDGLPNKHAIGFLSAINRGDLVPNPDGLKGIECAWRSVARAVN